MNNLIRWGVYPIIFGSAAAFQLALLDSGRDSWPLSIVVASVGIALVALVERIQPYETSWNHDHEDTIPDIFHAAFSLGFIFASVEVAELLRTILPVASVWPDQLPLWMQVAGAGLIIDFGLWLMHFLSHKNELLWRVHALHHSSERLYWLNGEKRHPVSAVLLAAPGTLAAIAMGAPASVIGCWYSIIAVHLAFQHSNIDYSVGPARSFLAVAEIHRWHHKRDYEDAQVNFGEFWMIWDLLFGTFHNTGNNVRKGEVGMRAPMPRSYWRQIVWPFSRQDRNVSQ